VAEVIEPSQERKERLSSQGPMESARRGMGRCISMQILAASERSSIQLFTMKETAVRGQIGEKRAR